MPVHMRKSAAIFSLGMALCLLFSLSLVLPMVIDDVSLERRLETEGIRTQGEVTGFHQIVAKGKESPARNGWHPEVTFQTPAGPVTIKAAGDRGLSDKDRASLSGTKVDITYLADAPGRARLAPWPETKYWMGFAALSLVFAVLSLVLLLTARQMWPKSVDALSPGHQA